MATSRVAFRGRSDTERSFRLRRSHPAPDRKEGSAASSSLLPRSFCAAGRLRGGCPPDCLPACLSAKEVWNADGRKELQGGRRNKERIASIAMKTRRCVDFASPSLPLALRRARWGQGSRQRNGRKTLGKCAARLCASTRRHRCSRASEALGEHGQIRWHADGAPSPYGRGGFAVIVFYRFRTYFRTRFLYSYCFKRLWLRYGEPDSFRLRMGRGVFSRTSRLCFRI